MYIILLCVCFYSSFHSLFPSFFLPFSFEEEKRRRGRGGLQQTKETDTTPHHTTPQDRTEQNRTEQNRTEQYEYEHPTRSVARHGSSSISKQPLVRGVGARTWQRQRAQGLSAAAAAANNPVALPDLAYDYGELEPTISGEIMELHHSKHHQTYVNNFNALMEQYAEAEEKQDCEEIALQPAFGLMEEGTSTTHLWTNLAPASAGGGGAPSGKLRPSLIASSEALKISRRSLPRRRRPCKVRDGDGSDTMPPLAA